jgi:hypothetical protein
LTRIRPRERAGGENSRRCLAGEAGQEQRREDVGRIIIDINAP